ncbi:MAG: hypothetical protein VKP62_06920 [Candidatus Sericytochromatia bacterium]|nr:hypothetical protein [Candidatus Sericytochromatia bacterium]
MFKHVALSFIALAILNGCHTAPLSVASVSTAGMSADALRGRKTGVGSTYDVSLRDDSLAKGAKIILSYHDAKGYFAPGAMAGDDLHAYIKVTPKSGKALEITSLRLNQDRGRQSFYAGSELVKGYAVKEIKAVELAFYMGKTWDSNLGKNYRVSF